MGGSSLQGLKMQSSVSTDRKARRYNRRRTSMTLTVHPLVDGIVVGSLVSVQVIVCRGGVDHPLNKGDRMILARKKLDEYDTLHR